MNQQPISSITASLFQSNSLAIRCWFHDTRVRRESLKLDRQIAAIGSPPAAAAATAAAAAPEGLNQQMPVTDRGMFDIRTTNFGWGIMTSI